MVADETGGSIVNISSVSAHGVRTGPPGLCRRQGRAWRDCSRLMAVQLGPLGIRVNTVVVGTTATPWLLSRKTDSELEQMRAIDTDRTDRRARATWPPWWPFCAHPTRNTLPAS